MGYSEMGRVRIRREGGWGGGGGTREGGGGCGSGM